MRYFFLLVVLLQNSCATPYQQPGLAGGVVAQQINATTYRIMASGNGFTSPATIQDYTMLKAAEVTLDAGATHFRIISAADATSVVRYRGPARAYTTFSGNSAYTTFTPGQVTQFRKPGQVMYIWVFTPKDGILPPGAQSAKEIVKFVGARVYR